MQIAVNFVTTPELPDVPSGSKEKFVVVIDGKRGGSHALAYFLKDYPVTMEYGCDSEGCKETHGRGCPVTGWYSVDSDFDAEDGKIPLLRRVLAWAPLKDVKIPKKVLSRVG